jgi:hypothetical protein
MAKFDQGVKKMRRATVSFFIYVIEIPYFNNRRKLSAKLPALLLLIVIIAPLIIQQSDTNNKRHDDMFNWLSFALILTRCNA